MQYARCVGQLQVQVLRLLFKFNGLSWTQLALKGIGQTPAGPQPMSYNLLPVCNNLPGAASGAHASGLGY
jgi:hypothetical protein